MFVSWFGAVAHEKLETVNSCMMINNLRSRDVYFVVVNKCTDVGKEKVKNKNAHPEFSSLTLRILFAILASPLSPRLYRRNICCRL